MVATAEEKIDEAIRPLVEVLNRNGFTTVGSCQGGQGHAFSLPTVQIKTAEPLDTLRERLAGFLADNGAEGFTLRTVCLYQRGLTPEPNSYVELEFWSQDTLMYLVF